VNTDFVPATIDATSWTALEPLFTQLEIRPVQSAAELERWLLDRSELDAACAEAQASLYINMTCDTENTGVQEAYERYIKAVPPMLKPASFRLDRRYAELASRFPVSPARYAVLDRDTRAEIELFRDENIPLQTELSLLSQKYEQVCGTMSVQFDGREQTMPQMARYQDSTDRRVRESAWRAVAERRLRDADAIHEVYDKMVGLRDRVGRNAGFPSYVGYAFKSNHRFDYAPEQCFAFHRACEQSIVPLVRALNASRAKRLGVDRLRPWDLSVDPKGRPPLRPFEGGRQLVSRTVATFEQLDPRLAAMVRTLGDGSNTKGASTGDCLDLDSRKGKAPGGYQYMRDRTRRPFIFMNAAGRVDDVQTMMHEAGHAFHSMVCNDEPLLHYRQSPTEFAEVASMTMELLTMPYTKKAGFYATDEEHARANRDELERRLSVLAWIATIDAFQHWVYTNPGHSRAEREAYWLSLDDRFGAAVSWEGIEHVRRVTWQRQLHLFSHPFYYIEYGIAQLGAFGLWLTSLEKGEKTAIDLYLKALRLGGSKPLPELFAAAGLPFDFGPEIVGRITERVGRELERMPE
jgi:oligoendopeptidase F